MKAPALALLLALSLGPLTAAKPVTPVPVAQGAGTYLARYLTVDGDAGLIARDAKLGFNRAFGLEAVRLLDEGAPDEFQRAVATVAIGASGLTEELGRLRAGALEGAALMKRASILALGELGPAGGKTLIGLLDDPELGKLATAALLRSGDIAGRKELLRRFKESGADSELLALIDFVDAPANFVEVPTTLRLLFQLRFEAARAFGLVDGQRWSVHLAEALSADDSFLDKVVFLSAADSHDASVRDFVLERLVDQGGAAPLLAAMRCMPEEFWALIDTGLYTPGGVAEWLLVIDEIESRGVVLEDAKLLSLAKSVPATELAALRLQAELGDRAAAESLRDLLGDPSVVRRAAAARGLGGTNDRSWIVELERMQNDPDAGVRAAALVARTRLGSGTASAIVKDIARDPAASEDRSALVVAMAATAKDAVIVPLLNMARDTAIGDERLVADLALRIRGDLLIGRELLEVLAQPSGIDGREWLVTALARNYNRQDLTLFQDIFPSERHPSLNTELAVALARGGSPEGIELLRKALWRGPFERSQLAAAALVDRGGLKSLTAELESVPLGTTADALRRVGYAVGVFGGLDELDRLRRRRSPADPALQGAFLGSLASRTF